MGLIKSAIYAGAGMYAVNQVVKATNNRQQNNNPNNSSRRANDNSYNDDRAYHPRPMEFREPSASRNGSRNASRSPQPPQYADATGPDASGQKRIDATSASQSQYQHDGFDDSIEYHNDIPQYAYADTPMQRSSREHYGSVQASGRRQGYVEDGEVYDDGRPMQGGMQGGNGGDLMAKLGPMAEQFMGGKSGSGGKSGKGDLLGKFMGGR